MTRFVHFQQSDVTRAIRGAKAAGMEIARCEIHPDGRIVIVPVGGDPADDDGPTHETFMARIAAMGAEATKKRGE